MEYEQASAVIIDGRTFKCGVGVIPLATIKSMTGLELLLKILNDELPQPSIHATLNFRMEAVRAGAAVFTGAPDQANLNPMGTVHGSYIMALLDSAMACSSHALCPAGTANTSVEMKINFMRPVLAGSGRLTATGTVINSGRTLSVTEGRLLGENGKLLAHATQTCMRIALD